MRSANAVEIAHVLLYPVAEV